MKIDKFVVKIASRCNINCTYCYMYNLGDLSYKQQPRFIDDNSTTENFVNKLIIHTQKNDIKAVFIIIHGGEPLLMKKDEFIGFIKHFDVLKNKSVSVNFTLQTNGILIDNEWIEIFKRNNIGIGVSLDGQKSDNDKYRVDKQGKGTYDRVINGIDILKKNKFEVSVLSVMNLSSNPMKYYEHFKGLGLKSADILLLDANHDNSDYIFNNEMSPADWYSEMFDRWFNDIDGNFRIRLFYVLIKEILGEEQNLDALGIHENNVLVLETNGDLEAVDVLKSCGDSFTKNGININHNDIDDVAKSDLIDVYYNSGKYLPRKCLACPIQDICGGGYLPHRFSSKNGFNNPTIYCDDLLKLITHIQNAVIDKMPDELVLETGLSKLSCEDAVRIIEEKLPTIPEPSYIKKLESFRKETYKNELV